jgi:hypothetical protein
VPWLAFSRVDFVDLKPMDGVDILLVPLAEVNHGVTELWNVRSFSRNHRRYPFWKLEACKSETHKFMSLPNTKGGSNLRKYFRDFIGYLNDRT